MSIFFGTGPGIVMPPRARAAGAAFNPTVPAAPPSPAIIYNGFTNSVILRDVKVIAIYWGQFWTTAPGPTALDITNAISTILGGPYFDALVQYHGTFGATPGKGLVEKSLIVNAPVGTSPADPPANFTDADVIDFVDNLIFTGVLPSPHLSPERVYLVVLPPACNGHAVPGGTVVGEHSVQPSTHGYTFLWAWALSQDAALTPQLGTLNDITPRISHEIVESVTDPFINAWADLSNPQNIVEIGDVRTDAGILGGVMVQEYWSQRDFDCIIPVAQLDLQPAPPGLPGPLGVVRGGWMRHVPANTGGTCNPAPNPDVTSFRNFSTLTGPPRGQVLVEGVRLEARSTTNQCCTCIAETKTFPMLGSMNTDEVDLRGWISTQRGAADPNSLCSIGIRLLRNLAPIPGASLMGATEPGRRSNCAGGFGSETVLMMRQGMPGPFIVQLHDIAANTVFDAIEFSLLSYACGTNVVNSIDVGGLQLTRHLP